MIVEESNILKEIRDLLKEILTALKSTSTPYVPARAPYIEPSPWIKPNDLQPLKEIPRPSVPGQPGTTPDLLLNCLTCGIDLTKPIGYVCGNTNCPTGLGTPSYGNVDGTK